MDNRSLKKVFLINPLITQGEVLSPPLGLAYLAGYARLFFPDCQFKIFDFDVNKTFLNDQVNIIKNESPDIIGITATTLSIASALKLAQLIKENCHNIPVFLGGSHTSAIPSQEYKYIDTIVIGEGEQAFVGLLKIHCSGKNLPKTYSAGFLQDINFFPAWDLVDFEKYAGFSPVKLKPQAIVFWSRGCPFNCVFCSNCVWRNSIPRVRYRNSKNIVDELEMLNKNYGIKEVFVGDDEINTNPKWLFEVCHEIIQRQLRIAWKCQMRANQSLTSLRLFKKMKKAGCWHIAWGIESGKDQVLKNIKKMITTHEIKRALTLSKKAGLKNLGLFMVGNIWKDKEGNLSGESFSNCQKSINFAKWLRDRNLLDYVNFNIATPYPGSEMWEIAEEFDLMKVKDFNQWTTEDMDLHGVSFNHPYLSEDKLLNLHKKAWATFVFNPKLILRHILNAQSLADIKNLFENAKIVLRVTLTGHTR